MKEVNRFEKSFTLIDRLEELIPGGCHTYSKGRDQGPYVGPKVIYKGKGSHIWDVDNNEYVDWSMGLGSVSLGHADDDVLFYVRNKLINGNNFNCPTPIELELAELFTNEVPSAEMVKFAKNGSTVTTAAIKLARAYTGKNYVAYCSDHGFFSYDDWFIGDKPNNAGVLQVTSNFSIGFKYNNIESLKEIFALKDVACVILEPMEFDFPENDFLQQVQQLCKENGAVFILDEMLTGFRVGFPGYHTAEGLNPDLVTWGKGVANGFSTCMLSGKRHIMNLGGINHDKERVFLISTTHGAETHTLAAAKATIEKLKEQDSFSRCKEYGSFLRREIEKIITDNGLSDFIKIKGHPCWQTMIFKNKEGAECYGLKTLILQELIKKGIFFRGLFFPTISHSILDIELTVEALNKAFRVYSMALESGYDKYLIGEPIKPVFRKYN